jgi:hypothetical protein
METGVWPTRSLLAAVFAIALTVTAYFQFEDAKDAMQEEASTTTAGEANIQNLLTTHQHFSRHQHPTTLQKRTPKRLKQRTPNGAKAYGPHNADGSLTASEMVPLQKKSAGVLRNGAANSGAASGPQGRVRTSAYPEKPLQFVPNSVHPIKMGGCCGELLMPATFTSNSF